MYITETTEKVKQLIENLEEKSDKEKMQFLLYISECLINNQINSKNLINPMLVEDDEVNIFNMQSINITDGFELIFLQSNMTIYNSINQEEKIYEENGNIYGIEYKETIKKIISEFEDLSFNEKLDILSEIFIRYDNNTYFNENISKQKLNFNYTGFDLAYRIKQFKKSLF